MSINSLLPTYDREWCLLCDFDTFAVISIQLASPAQRIPANNFTWMRRANRRWVTIEEFVKEFGQQADSALSSYSPTYTVEHLRAMNERLK
jgi:hypothetical protein